MMAWVESKGITARIAAIDAHLATLDKEAARLNAERQMLSEALTKLGEIEASLDSITPRQARRGGRRSRHDEEIAEMTRAGKSIPEIMQKTGLGKTAVTNARRRTDTAQNPAPPAKHGTSSGYHRHLREGTEPCAPCLQANRDRARAYYEQTKKK